MILFNLQKLIRLELKNTYPKLSIGLIELTGLLFSLSLYYFTSQAFVPKQSAELNFYGMNYFSFVIIGELSLSLPCFFLSHPALKLNELVVTQILFNLWSYPKQLWKILSNFTLASSSLEFFRILVNFVLALVLFDLSLEIYQIFIILTLVLLCTPIFIGLGLISSALSIYLKKRGGVTAQLMTLSLFLAGAYFPLGVLPVFVKDLCLWLSPFNPLMQLIRETVSGQYSDDLVLIMSSLTVWFILAPTVGIVLMNFAERHLKRTGDPLLFTR